MLMAYSEVTKLPELQEKLYQELKDVDLTDLNRLTALPLLNGVIQEALRLYPVLPTNGNRKTSVNGTYIAGKFIPPNTTVTAPRFCIGRRRFSLSLSLSLFV
jgi:tryprostatin B 6-hydroxylase